MDWLGIRGPSTLISFHFYFLLHGGIKNAKSLDGLLFHLIERLIKLKLAYSARRFVRRGLYLAALPSLLTLLNSKPIVSSSRYTPVLLITKTRRSGLRELPVIKDGDGKKEDRHTMRYS